MTYGQIMALLNPVLAILLASTFYVIWLNYRHLSYVIHLSMAFFIIALAISSQVFLIPPDIGQNAIVSCVFYISGLICLSSGVLKRAGLSFDFIAYGLILTITTGLVYYFAFEDVNLTIRIYVVNFSAGIIFIITAFKIRPQRKKPLVERALFWVILLTGLHFFPRTILTASFRTPLQTPDSFYGSSFWLFLNLSVAVAFLAIAVALLAAVASDIISDFKKQSGTDALTGLANRRGFEETAKEKLSEEEGKPISLVFCDIDHFKTVNDTFGHAAGDLALQEFSGILVAAARQSDMIGRFGGEEFVILLINADSQAALSFTERVRNRLREARFESIPGLTSMTASFGIAEHVPGEALHNLIHRADAMTYKAKRAGRDLACIDGLE